MTEQERLESNATREMLEFLWGKGSDRKLRLFACGFCRSIDEVLADEDCRDAVQVAEQFADGVASREELDAAWRTARAVWEVSEWKSMLAAKATDWSAWTAALSVHLVLGIDNNPLKFWRRQSDILRCIVGPLPFSSVFIDPAWLTWHGGLLVSMARQMYDSRDFSDLSVMADALEEAGCANPDILSHCRQQGAVHVRGCWVVDLLLGKE
jgi:hypothetical protein